MQQQHSPMQLLWNPRHVHEEVWWSGAVVVVLRASFQSAQYYHRRRFCCRPAERIPTFYAVWSSATVARITDNKGCLQEGSEVWRETESDECVLHMKGSTKISIITRNWKDTLYGTQRKL
jgi:hypothetical protein